MDEVVRMKSRPKEVWDKVDIRTLYASLWGVRTNTLVENFKVYINNVM